MNKTKKKKTIADFMAEIAARTGPPQRSLISSAGGEPHLPIPPAQPPRGWSLSLQPQAADRGPIGLMGVGAETGQPVMTAKEAADELWDIDNKQGWIGSLHGLLDPVHRIELERISEGIRRVPGAAYHVPIGPPAVTRPMLSGQEEAAPTPSAMDQFLQQKQENQGSVSAPSAQPEDLVGKFQVPDTAPNRPAVGSSAEDIEKRKRRMKMIGGVFEGGRKFLQGVQAGSLIRAGINPNAIDLGTGREQIDEEIGRLDDTLSNEERKFVKTQLGLDLPPNMTRTQIRALQPIIATNRAQGKEENQIEMAAIRAVNSDQEGREARHALSTIRAIKSLLAENSSTADNGILAKIPSIFESTTHISNFDAQRWRQRPGIQGMADRAYTLASGRISPAHRKEITEMIESLERPASEALDRVTNRVAAQFGSVGSIDPKKIQNILMAGSGQDLSSNAGGSVTFKDKQTGKEETITAEQWALIKNNPRVERVR